MKIYKLHNVTPRIRQEMEFSPFQPCTLLLVVHCVQFETNAGQLEGAPLELKMRREHKFFIERNDLQSKLEYFTDQFIRCSTASC